MVRSVFLYIRLAANKNGRFIIPIGMNMMGSGDSSDEDDKPKLCPETLAILQEFLQEQESENSSLDVSEDWQLSQFWYSEETCKHLAQAAVKNVSKGGSIALVSSPSLYKYIKTIVTDLELGVCVKLFEFDKRFSIHGEDFNFYDYNEPLAVDSAYQGYFDMIFIDPPFLSEECLTKVSKTIDFMKKETCKVVLCTGAVMKDLGERLLVLKKCCFKPTHRKNLGNEFICMTNFGEINDVT